MRAALDLIVEQGFDRTTVAEIAGRAGLIKRSFFNHFVDEPEVLFWGHDVLREVYETSIADAPPLEVLASALHAAAALHEPRPDLIRTRHAVIAAHPPLQEREHLERATVADRWGADPSLDGRLGTLVIEALELLRSARPPPVRTRDVGRSRREPIRNREAPAHAPLLA